MKIIKAIVTCSYLLSILLFIVGTVALAFKPSPWLGLIVFSVELFVASGLLLSDIDEYAKRFRQNKRT